MVVILELVEPLATEPDIAVRLSLVQKPDQFTAGSSD